MIGLRLRHLQLTRILPSGLPTHVEIVGCPTVSCQALWHRTVCHSPRLLRRVEQQVVCPSPFGCTQPSVVHCSSGAGYEGGSDPPTSSADDIISVNLPRESSTSGDDRYEFPRCFVRRRWNPQSS